MRVNKLHVTSFRNIIETTLDTGGAKFCVLRGRNGQGKTSLSEALSLALTDTTWGLDKRGAGFVRKIRRGEPKATIEVDLQGANREIRRTVSLSVTSTGRTQSSKDLNDVDWHPKKFDDLLIQKKAALGIAVNTRAFMSMVYARDEDSQKSLLASLVLPARYDFPKETIADVDSLLGQGTVIFEGEPFAVIEQAYKKLFAERQDANKKVKEFIIPTALQRPQGVNSESLQSQLAMLREDRRKQATERDTASKQANEAGMKRERLNARIETLEAVLKASKEALRALQESVLSDPAAVQQSAANKAEYDRLVADLPRINAEQEVARKEQDRLKKLSLVGTTCPTCDQDIDEAKLVELMTVSVAEYERLKEQRDRITERLRELGNVDAAVAQWEKHTKSLAGKVEAEAKVEVDAKALESAKDEANASIGGLFDSALFDNALSRTDSDIEAILSQIQPVIAAEERDKEITAKKEQFKRLEDKAAKLDRLVKYFDKDGIKAKLIAEYIGGFERKVNTVLSAWKYSCSLSIEPFKFEVTDYRNVSTPLIDLSGAEELMFYAAFQCAVSQTAGIGFVVIDRVDTLLPDLRPALYKNLFQMLTDGMLDQVILLVADTSEQVPKIPDSRFFVIEEGNIRRLG